MGEAKSPIIDLTREGSWKGITLELFEEARDILTSPAFPPDGYWTYGPYKMPRTKKRRIRNKWVKNGKAWCMKYHKA